MLEDWLTSARIHTVLRRSLEIRVFEQDATSNITPDAEVLALPPPSVFDYFSLLLTKNPSLKPNVRGKLFTIVDYILRSLSECDEPNSSAEFVWPCAENYAGGIKSYKYDNVDVEMSILSEKNPLDNDRYYFLCLSCPSNPLQYWVTAINVIEEPKSEKETQVWNEVLISNVYNLVTDCVESFLAPVLNNKKVKKDEFSTYCVYPLLHKDISVEPPKKRMKLTEDQPACSSKDATTAYKTTRMPPYYKRLYNMYSKMEEKPNAISKLFAFLLSFFVFIGYRAKIPDKEWPGTVNYENEPFTVVVRSMEFKKSTVPSETPISFSLLSNEREFFLCLRFKFDSSKICIRKIDRSFVPTFNLEDARMEKKRIEQVNLWIINIMNKFIYKEIKCTPTPFRASIKSDPSTSSDHSSSISEAGSTSVAEK